LSFTGGVRETWEDVGLHQLPSGVYYGLPDLKTSFSDPSWQVGLDYKPNDEWMIYVVQRGSWRSGGFNAFSSPAVGAGFTLLDGIEFKSETVRDVELGFKFQGNVAGAPARLNVATYYEITDNVQRNLAVNLGGGPGSATVNVPQAKVDGVEVDGEIKPTAWLLVGGNAAYTNARFSDATTDVAGVQTTFGPFPDSPHWATSVFSQVFFPVPDDLGKWSLRGDVYHQTTSYFSSLDATIIPGTELPGYTIANFRMEMNQIAGSGVSAALYVNNAFNREYLTGGLALGALFGLNIATVAPPQTYGAELSYRF
jgi:iron complex outermembrane receptor protein